MLEDLLYDADPARRFGLVEISVCDHNGIEALPHAQLAADLADDLLDGVHGALEACVFPGEARRQVNHSGGRVRGV